MPPRPPSLRSVAAFEAAARHESFSRAAAELSLTSSAISHSVRALEERLGQRLFRRMGRGVALTPAGKALAGRIAQGLNLLNAAFDTKPWAERSPFVIAAPQSIVSRWVLPTLASLLERPLDHTPVLRTGGDLRAVQEGEVDMAICYGVGPWPGLSAELLFRDDLVVACSPSYRGGKLPRTAAEILAGDLIDDPHNPWLFFQDQLLPGAPPTKPKLSFEDYGALVEAACRGLGLILARRNMSDSEFESGLLTPLGPHPLRTDAAYWLVWSESNLNRTAIYTWKASLQSRLPGKSPRAEPQPAERAAAPGVRSGSRW